MCATRSASHSEADANATLTATWESVLEYMREEIARLESSENLTPGQKIRRVLHAMSVSVTAASLRSAGWSDGSGPVRVRGNAGTKIAELHGVSLSEVDASKHITHGLDLIGRGTQTQQFAAGLCEQLTHMLGRVSTLPVVYGLNHAIGAVIDATFKDLAAGREPDRGLLQAVYRQARLVGERRGTDPRIGREVTELQRRFEAEQTLSFSSGERTR
ncbi:hypothetical protein N9971_00150 [bacterium]|nr:hypothetical protein [bacterium]